MSDYEQRTGKLFQDMGRDEEWAMFTGKPKPSTPEMPCKHCGGRLSVAGPDYYAGILSCESCRQVASPDDLRAWEKEHAPTEEAIAAWRRGE